MWDEYTPLQLLKTMPRKLNQENLSKIQMVIDADKYKNSLVSGFDLCGIYAPFCRGCDKTSIYPCAIAYIRMMQADGMNIEIDASPVLNGTAKKYTAKPEIPQTQPRQEAQNSVPVAREIKISEYKPVKPRAVQEVKFRERKEYKSKLSENTVREVAVTESDDEPVLILPELKNSPDLKTTEEIEDTEIFVPVKETVTEPAPSEFEAEAVEVAEQPENLPAIAPLKEEAPAAEPVKRRIRIAVARRKL